MLLAADNGVFSGTDDGMVSYSAGSKMISSQALLYMKMLVNLSAV